MCEEHEVVHCEQARLCSLRLSDNIIRHESADPPPHTHTHLVDGGVVALLGGAHRALGAVACPGGWGGGRGVGVRFSRQEVRGECSQPSGSLANTDNSHTEQMPPSLLSATLEVVRELVSVPYSTNLCPPAHA